MKGLAIKRKAQTVETLLAQEKWHDERILLRTIILECPVEETVKWGQLCYCHKGANLALFFGLKDYCGIGFVKGVLQRDPLGLLNAQGENSQSVRLLRFTSVAEIAERKEVIKAYMLEAIEIEKSGAKVDFPQKDNLDYCAELVAALDADPEFASAFEALTPGRRRGYHLFFSAAKQPKTREARIAKHRARILAGKGLQDR